MPKLAATWPCLPFLCALLAMGGTAQAEERYAGRLSCAAIPGSTRGPVNVEISLVRNGSELLYQRPILSLAGRETTGMESGSGTVSPNGAVTLQAAGHGNDTQFTARYAGTLASNHLDLSAVQLWALRRGESFERPCTASLRRR